MKEKVKILAVDDRQENLLALEAVLSSPHYELVLLRSGEEALRYLLVEDVRDVSVILMDVQMPGMNGFETVELIKRRERCSEIPVIFLTAISTSMDHVLRGYHAGSIDYLSKPVHPELLRLKVDAFVKLHGYHQKMLQQGELLQKRAVELTAMNERLARAEEQLKGQNERLETMVRERTRELLIANERLGKSQVRFKRMFLSSPCLMAIRSLADQRYIDVNDSWKQHTGYDASVIGQTADLLHIAAESGEEQELEPGEALRNMRIKYTNKAKELRNGLLSTEVIDVDDEKCLVQVIVDITEQVRLEREMTRMAQLNLVGEMAAGIAHEIRNPMTAIRGFLQLSQANGGRMERDYLDIMLTELDRANSIITEYLSLAKNKQTDLQSADLNAIIETLQPLIQAEALMSGKYVLIESGACPTLLLDEKEIRQLILNMAMNGLEAMEAGGSLTMATYVECGEVVLRISDEGGGIAEAHLEKLGRPFFTTKEQGTGLGLAVCYSIAGRHRAQIDVESGSGGTTFYVRFTKKAT